MGSQGFFCSTKVTQQLYGIIQIIELKGSCESLLRAGIILCNFHVPNFVLAQCLLNICRLSELILTNSYILQMKTTKLHNLDVHKMLYLKLFFLLTEQRKILFYFRNNVF